MSRAGRYLGRAEAPGRPIWGAIRWRRVLGAPLFVAFALFNAWMLSWFFRWAMFDGFRENDWGIFVGLDPARPYLTDGFHWMLPAAWLWVGIVQPLGFGLWSALHLAALATIRDRRVVLLALATFPFWHDVVSGNMLTFVFVAAWWALAGNRWGVAAFCVLAALVPRPLMIPVLAYLLVRDGRARIVFPLAAGFVLLWTILAGQFEATVRALLLVPGTQMDAALNIGPSRWLGSAWLLVAWPLAAFAWWRGRLGLASVLASPYWIHYYLVMLFLEVSSTGRTRRVVGRPSLSRPDREALVAVSVKQRPSR